ncbi:hypothetical protein HNR40_008910 [Nonomuraea endophytica]|uniref:Uncharacterized protein n=1 Tax=Nonomuraea endophytica TaxID=714136 RepID=A0A7W8AE46_9ACTN|nr:hypothetical protein [Nonomuraea endophytica]
MVGRHGAGTRGAGRDARRRKPGHRRDQGHGRRQHVGTGTRRHEARGRRPDGRRRREVAGGVAVHGEPEVPWAEGRRCGGQAKGRGVVGGRPERRTAGGRRCGAGGRRCGAGGRRCGAGGRGVRRPERAEVWWMAGGVGRPGRAEVAGGGAGRWGGRWGGGRLGVGRVGDCALKWVFSGISHCENRHTVPIAQFPSRNCASAPGGDQHVDRLSEGVHLGHGPSPGPRERRTPRGGYPSQSA